MEGGDFASRRIQLVAVLGGGDAQVIWTSPKGAKLWLGSAAASLTKTVSERKIGAVVRLLADKEVDDTLREQPLDVPGIRMLWIRAPDRASTDLLPFFEHTCAFLDRHFGDEDSSEEGSGPSVGSNALIHCVMGVSRSASVAAAFLMYLQRPQPDTTTQVILRIRASRGAVRPNAGFTRQLDHWQQHLKEGTVPSDDFKSQHVDQQQAQLVVKVGGMLPKCQEDSWVRSGWAAWCAEQWTQPKGFLQSRTLSDIVRETRDDMMLLQSCVFRALEWVLGGCGREPMRVRWMEDLLSYYASAPAFTPDDHQSPKLGTADSISRNEPMEGLAAASIEHPLPADAENPMVEDLLLKTLLSHEWLETWASDVPLLMAADGLAARWLVAAKGLRVAQEQQHCLRGLAAEVARLAADFHHHTDDDSPKEMLGALAIIGDND